MLASCAGVEVEEEVKEELKEEKRLKLSNIQIGNLEVMTEDLEVGTNVLGKMTWVDAMKACANLGEGWRLPTKDELNLLYENKDKIGGFGSVYWSSTEFDKGGAWKQYFSDGLQDVSAKDGNDYVRAVRSI